MVVRPLLLALGLVLAGTTHAETGQQRLDRFLDGMRTLSADFVQQVFAHGANYRRAGDCAEVITQTGMLAR